MYALLVIDMLNDFVKPDGALPIPKAQDIVKNINTLIKDFHSTNDLVIFVNDTHEINDPEFTSFPPHCIKGTPGAKVYFKILDEPSVTIEKTTYSAFAEASLQDYLIEMRVDAILLCGVATDICIKAATEGAILRGFRVIVVEDAVKGLTQQAHNSAIKNMRQLGAKIRNTEDILCG